MKFLLSHRHKLLYNRHEIPFRYRSERVPGALSSYVRGDFGDYLIQIVPVRGCSLQLNLFRIEKAAYLHPYTPFPVLPLHFMLKNSVRCSLEGFGEARLPENGYHLFYVPGRVRHHAWFRPGSYRSFHIDFSPAYLQQLAGKYQELKEVRERLLRQSPEGVRQHAATLTPAIRELIRSLLYDRPEEPAQQEVFVEITAKALLLKYVQDRPVDPAVLAGHNARIMEDVLDYIRLHPDHPHTVFSLSQRYSMSQAVFRRRFVQHTGHPFRRFLLEVRMKRAMQLLTTTSRPVGDIALDVGYGEHSNFDRAFLKQFGHSPSYYRSGPSDPSGRK